MDPMTPGGSGIVRDGLVTIKAELSGTTFKVAAWTAPNFQHFVDGYEAAGGVLGPNTGTLDSRPANKSCHPLARAINVNQIGRGIRGGGRTLDRETEDRLADESGLYPGSRFGDIGHFEARNRVYAQAKAKGFTDPDGLGGRTCRTARSTAPITVDFTNMPKGARTSYSGQPGLFKEVKLNRGRAMGFASQDS
jgi:hypothetical protein